LRVPIAIGRFYKQCLWIPQMFLLTNPELHHGLLGNQLLAGASGLDLSNECAEHSLNFDSLIVHTCIGFARDKR
jgi:hypothetical protein